MTACALALLLLGAQQTTPPQVPSKATPKKAPPAKTGLAVVSDEKASPAEKQAATELAKYLTKITGYQVGAEGSMHIYVGATPKAKELCPDIPWDKLGAEEVVLRTVGKDMVVAGGSPRGTLYAAYRLLGRFGVRWWTPWAVDIPRNANLHLPKLNVREAPAFEYREPYWHDTFDQDWMVANGVNGPLTPMDDQHGGRVEYEGFVHTFYPLVPPDKYFGPHPEWYSLINGKRVDQNAQLCTTNPELRKFVLEEVRRRLRANSKATIVSVSQNDCFNPCQCDNCQALVKAEGSESAPVLALANYVAEGIKEEFPNVAVDTLAYQYTRHAPKTLKPLPNVIVRLCSIECDFGVPLTHPRNAAFANDIRDWSRLTNRLYVWDYVTNFGHYVQPLPNVHVLGPNLKFFSENGVKGVFEEGDYTSSGGDMAELKAWMLAQLLWDPKADARKLRDEFLNGYYHEAGKSMGRYLDLLEKAAENHPAHIWDDSSVGYFDYATLMRADKLFNDAMEAVALDPVGIARVTYARLPLRYVWLQRWQTLRRDVQQHGDKWSHGQSRAEAARQWLAQATNPQFDAIPPITAINEGGMTPAQFASQMSLDPPPPAERHEVTRPDDATNGWIDAQDDRASLWREPYGAALMTDKVASDGAACRMPGEHHEWAFQIPLKDFPKLRTGRWKVRLVARVESEAGDFPAFTAGIYDPDGQKDVADLKVSAQEAGAAYKTYDLGTLALPANGYVWVAPPADKRVTWVWIDRVYFVPEKG